MKKVAILFFSMLFFVRGIGQQINLFFGSDRSTLSRNTLAKFDQLLKEYKTNSFKIILKGYADLSGDSLYNIDLSKKRVAFVKTFLVQQKVRENDILTEFYGESASTGYNRYLDRKVEVFIEQAGLSGIKNYDDYIETILPKEETFVADPTQPILFEGKKGTTISIPANAFRNASGNDVKGPVILHLKEYYSLTDFVSDRLGTVADGNFLITSGMVNIKAMQNSTEVYLKDSSELQITFPRNNSKDRFYTFYGERTKDGNMNWQLDQSLWDRKQKDIGVTFNEEGSTLIVTDRQVAEKRNETLLLDRTTGLFRKMTEEDKKEMELMSLFNEKYYATISSCKMEWINCDRFLTDPSVEIVDYYVTIKNPDVDIKNVYLIYTDLNSMLMLSREDGRYHLYNRLPLARKPFLLVTGMKQGLLYLYYEKISADNKTDVVELKESSFEKLDKILKSSTVMQLN